MIKNTHKNFSPSKVPIVRLILSEGLKEKITKIEDEFDFKKDFLLAALDDLVNSLNLEKNLDIQNIRNSNIRTSLVLLKKHAKAIVKELNICGTVTRDIVNDTIDAAFDDNLNPFNADILDSSRPSFIEDNLTCFTVVCQRALNKIPIDKGGNRKNTSIPQKITFFLMEKYSLGTGQKPTNYTEGKLQDFLIKINPILLEIDQSLNLGTCESIQKNASEALASITRNKNKQSV